MKHKLLYWMNTLAGGDGNSWVLSSGGTRANLDIDFVNNRAYNNGGSSISSLLTCNRDTPALAYYTNADGTLRTFAPDTLRYGTNGLLVEEARTNLALHSQDFSNAVWNYSGGSFVGANTSTAPDGTVTADTVSLPVDGNAFIRQIIACTNVPHTFSFYGRVASGTYDIKLGIYDASTIDVRSSTKVMTTEWQRFDFTATPAATNVHFYLTCEAGVGGNFQIWGWEVEAGSFATSYIPTTTASVTRAADVVPLSTINFYNQNAGSWYYQGSGVAVTSGDRCIAYGGVAGNQASMVIASNTHAAGWNGSSQVTAAAGSGNWLSGAKAALSYDAAERNCVMNNGTVATESGTFGTTVSGIEIGMGASTWTNGYCRRVAYWNTMLADAALKALTV